MEQEGETVNSEETYNEIADIRSDMQKLRHRIEDIIDNWKISDDKDINAMLFSLNDAYDKLNRSREATTHALGHVKDYICEGGI